MGRRFVIGEWILRITGSRRRQPDRIRVEIENVGRRDLRFATAIAQAVRAWLVARGGRP